MSTEEKQRIVRGGYSFKQDLDSKEITDLQVSSLEGLAKQEFFLVMVSKAPSPCCMDPHLFEVFEDADNYAIQHPSSLGDKPKKSPVYKGRYAFVQSPYGIYSPLDFKLTNLQPIDND